MKTQIWLCSGIYKPPSQKIIFLKNIFPKVLSKLTSQYDNIMLIGDFNLTVNKKNRNIQERFNLERLISKLTCFHSANSTFTDLILTNQKDLFKNLNILEVGISDHRSFITTAEKPVSKSKYKNENVPKL